MASKPVESAVRSKYWRSEKDSRKEVSGQEQRRPLLSEILTNKAPPPYTLSAYMAYLSQNQCLKNLEFIMDSSRYRKLVQASLLFLMELINFEDTTSKWKNAMDLRTRSRP